RLMLEEGPAARRKKVPFRDPAAASAAAEKHGRTGQAGPPGGCPAASALRLRFTASFALPPKGRAQTAP
ncbi:MAG TPA: hypothetical protein PK597_06455, partial [Oscillospiraceae bacterium]|nr:hypothetical protein [Oscillospiraceae bacterium]